MTLSTFKYVLAAVGLVTLLGSFVVCDHTASFAHRAARAQGTVTALLKQDASDYSSSNGGMPTPCYTYQAVVQFRHGAQRTLSYDSGGIGTLLLTIGAAIFLRSRNGAVRV